MIQLRMYLLPEYYIVTENFFLIFYFYYLFARFDFTTLNVKVIKFKFSKINLLLINTTLVKLD